MKDSIFRADIPESTKQIFVAKFGYNKGEFRETEKLSQFL